MIEESRQASGELLLRVDGTFDAAVAWELRGRIGGCAAGERVVLDFTRVREFADLGIAVVANGLAGVERPAVQMRGLRDHQHRLFRYFGVDVDALGGGDPAARAASPER